MNEQLFLECLDRSAASHGWKKAVDGSYRRPGRGPSPARALCMLDGERAPHSHYEWAASSFACVLGSASVKSGA